MSKKAPNQNSNSLPLPDRGAAVDEHGRAPGVPSRTGTGAGPPADPDRVDRARARPSGKRTGHQRPEGGQPVE
ncbi:hypothetical protein OV450_0041 [Actinobacteria bacterium OV450]|nr:hypothetical protein OV450_0041 [Actinobacteria bacterium OV450]